MKLLQATVLFIGFALTSSAWAHVGLNNSNPANGAMLNEAPSTLELTFSGPARLIQLSLKDQAQNEIALTLPSRRQSATQFSIPLPELAASEYTVSWMIMGEDTHKMQGDFKFMVHSARAYETSLTGSH